MLHGPGKFRFLRGLIHLCLLFLNTQDSFLNRFNQFNAVREFFVFFNDPEGLLICLSGLIKETLFFVKSALL